MTPSADAGALPAGWSAGTPGEQDVDALVALRRSSQEAGRGWASASVDDVAVELTGRGAATRRHVALWDARGELRAAATAHDRAAGRTLVSVAVDPGAAPDDAARAAGWLLGWVRTAARDIGRARGLASTQLDSGAFAGDQRQRGWLTDAGFELARTWWQMSRPVRHEESRDGVLQPPRQGVVVRRVGTATDGMPDETDLRTVHDVLEEAFDDHFNYHTETFHEFCSRLREDPGHRWDHWWVAELDDAGTAAPLPVGALVATALLSGGDGPHGSYVDYLGVLPAARGRGVAKALLHAVIADAAARGRDRVGLEVDADSPTGAGGLYVAMGFVTRYVTESWHLEVAVDG